MSDTKAPSQPEWLRHLRATYAELLEDVKRLEAEAHHTKVFAWESYQRLRAANITVPPPYWYFERAKRVEPQDEPDVAYLVQSGTPGNLGTARLESANGTMAEAFRRVSDQILAIAAPPPPDAPAPEPVSAPPAKRETRRRYWSETDDAFLIRQVKDFTDRSKSSSEWADLARAFRVTPAAAYTHYGDLKRDGRVPYDHGHRRPRSKATGSAQHMWRKEEVDLIFFEVSRHGDTSTHSPVWVELGNFFEVTPEAVRQRWYAELVQQGKWK